METFSRGRYVLRISVFVIALCLAPVAVLAQEASIIGQVTDDTGAVLPGVTVVATSPSLQVPQVGVVTNERRHFTHAAQVSALATEMKSYAKTLPGSVFSIDRRQDASPSDEIHIATPGGSLSALGRTGVSGGGDVK